MFVAERVPPQRRRRRVWEPVRWSLRGRVGRSDAGSMNLLPKSAKDFGSVDYWEKFFQQRGKKAFEWYGSYLELCGVLHKYIKPREKVSAAWRPGCARPRAPSRASALGACWGPGSPHHSAQRKVNVPASGLSENRPPAASPSSNH